MWRIVSWPFVQDDPFTLLFGGFMLYWLGQQLAFVWSERRLLLRFFGYAAFASLATTFVALVWSPAARPHIGVWPVANALIVSWAMMYPDRQVNVWGVLPITGKTAALLVVGGTFLYGIAGGGIRGIGAFTPHLSRDRHRVGALARRRRPPAAGVARGSGGASASRSGARATSRS